MPGKHMSGHYGNESATVLNQLVVAVDAEKNYILVRGGLPGPRKSIVVLRTHIKEVKHPEPVKPLINRTPVAEAPAQEAPAAEAAE
jgi:large subunit ribosomal protein L3